MGTIFKRKLLSITAVRKNYCSFDANLHASCIMHHLFDDKERFIYFIIPNCKDFLKMDMCRYFPNKWKKSLFGEERDHIYIQNVISNLQHV